MLEMFLSAVIVVIAWFWSTSLKARETALAAVRRRCLRLQVQLLDDCVALTGLWPRRDAVGKLQAWRSYAFEFSVSGDDRYHGKIVLLGSKVEGIYLEPHIDPTQVDN